VSEPRTLPKFITVAELAEMLGRSTESVYQACKRGEITGSFQIGRLWHVNLEAFMASTEGQQARQSAA
jgi:excisionase family DNA binding protein